MKYTQSKTYIGHSLPSVKLFEARRTCEIKRVGYKMCIAFTQVLL